MTTFKLYRYSKSIILKILLVGVFFSLQSCLAMLLIKNNSKPKIEHDDIKGITRFKSTLFYYLSEERNSSFIKNEQLIYKETNGFKQEYKFYDYLQLESRLKSIENTIYFIVDGRNYPIEIHSQSKESLTEVDKEEEDLILADSSTTSVIRDYEIRNYSLISIQYTLEENLIREIANAEDVKIRYYAPPEMITLELSNLKLKAFRALAEAEYEYNRFSQ